MTLTGDCGSCWVSMHADAGAGSVWRVNPWPGVLCPGTGADYSPTSGEGEQWGLHLASQVGWTRVKGGPPARPTCPRGPGVLGPTWTHTVDSCSLRGALCPQLITPGDGPWGRQWGPHLHPSKQTTVPHRTCETRRGVLLTHVGARFCVCARGWCSVGRPTLASSPNGVRSACSSAPSMERTSTARSLGAFGTCPFTSSTEMSSAGTPS